MTIVSFPGCRRPEPQANVPVGQPLSELDQKRLAFIESFEPETQPVMNQSEAVRHFALSVAEKLRQDPELNNLSPLLVDKVVMMLVKESRT